VFFFLWQYWAFNGEQKCEGREVETKDLFRLRGQSGRASLLVSSTCDPALE